MKKRLLVILLHLFAWFAFLALPYMFKPDHTISDRQLSEISNGFLCILIFYTNYLFVIPQYYRRRKYWPLILSLVVSTGLLLLLNSLIQPELFDVNTTYALSGPFYRLFMFVIVVVFSFMLSFYEQMRRMEKERLYNEILFLKSQVNPHFLFNTLNSIYSLSLTRSDKAPDAIVRLSSLFRYRVTDAGKNLVLLEKELTYISDYIALQKLRLTDNVDLKYSITGDTRTYEIIPFALIPFIEDALKYGVNSQENSRIDVSIAIKDEILTLQVRYNKVHVEKDESINSGLGMENAARRIQSAYPKKHSLEIDDGSEAFYVRLTIDLSR